MNFFLSGEALAEEEEEEQFFDSSHSTVGYERPGLFELRVLYCVKIKLHSCQKHT